MDNHGTSLLDGWISSWDGWWGWSNGWICLAYQADLQRQKYCTLEWSEIFVDNWTVGRRSPIAVDYCLVSETANNEERCGLHYSTHVLIIVCVCIFLESLMILWTWGLYLNSSTNPDIKSAKRTMVTMGDAIHSFLEHPLADGHNLMDSTIQGKKIRVNNERWTTRKLTRWYEAVSWCTWIVSGLL